MSDDCLSFGCVPPKAFRLFAARRAFQHIISAFAMCHVDEYCSAVCLVQLLADGLSRFTASAVTIPYGALTRRR